MRSILVDLGIVTLFSRNSAPLTARTCPTSLANVVTESKKQWCIPTADRIKATLDKGLQECPGS